MSGYSTGILAILCYLSGSLMVFMQLRRASAPSSVSLPVVGLGTLGVLLHGISLYPLLYGAPGINLGFFNALSLVGLISAALLVAATLRRPAGNLAVFVFPLAAIGVVLMYLFPESHPLRYQTSWQLDVHILLSVVAYSLFAIAAVQALVLAFQDWRLRGKHPGGVMRALPPMQIMEDLLFQIIGVGFFLLTLALLSGFFFLEDIFAQHLVHKTVLSITAWVVFAILLWGRHQHGWRGITAIRWTLGGFVLLMLAYFGTKLVLELVLHRT